MIKNAYQRIAHLVVMVFAAIISFGAVAHAADQVTTSDSSLIDLAKPVFEAFSGGHYAYAAALLVILLLALIKRYAWGGFETWIHTDLGGTIMALVTSAAAAVSAGLAAPGAHVTLSLLKSALLVGVGAAGGFAVLKNLVFEPLLKPLEAKLEAKYPKLAPLLSIITWIFDKPDPVAQATAAGSAAVAANPAQGVAGLATATAAAASPDQPAPATATVGQATEVK